MPRIMHVYSPMEIVVTPDTTHILIEHIHDNRRAHTDGRDWPADMAANPMFAGYSTGRCVDEKGEGRYDTLLVETRGLKGPGGPASHGCIRLHPSDAAVLYTLVRTEGMSATTIIVSGSNTAAARDQPYFNYGTPYSNYGTPYAPGYRWPENPNAYRPFYPY